MEAVVVAGGLGTRLRPLTLERPKHLLPLAGVPLLSHVLAKLAAAGVDHAVLATAHPAAVFAAVLDRLPSGMIAEVVTEPVPLGTGGAIRNAAAALRSGPDDAVVVLNGDQMSGHDLAAQLRRHREEHAEVTLHLVEVDDPRAFGCVPTDEAGRVTAFHEKSPNPVTNQVNAGCYVFRRTVLEQVPPGRAVSVERETFPALVAAGARVVGYVEQSYWSDVGTPAALVECSRDLVLGLTASAAYPFPAAQRRVLEGAAVDGAADVAGGSTVCAGAVVARGARVDGSIVMTGAHVGPDAVVTSSVVAPAARIGAGSVLDQAVVGDRAVVGAGCRLAPGTRVPVDAVLDPAQAAPGSGESV